MDELELGFVVLGVADSSLGALLARLERFLKFTGSRFVGSAYQYKLNGETGYFAPKPEGEDSVLQTPSGIFGELARPEEDCLSLGGFFFPHTQSEGTHFHSFEAKIGLLGTGFGRPLYDHSLRCNSSSYWGVRLTFYDSEDCSVTRTGRKTGSLDSICSEMIAVALRECFDAHLAFAVVDGAPEVGTHLGLAPAALSSTYFRALCRSEQNLLELPDSGCKGTVVLGEYNTEARFVSCLSRDWLCTKSEPSLSSFPLISDNLVLDPGLVIARFAGAKDLELGT